MSKQTANLPAPRLKLRCAVYTRKSNEDGLEMEFNSLDAQREACEAYILSQRGKAGYRSTTATTPAASPAARWGAPPSSGYWRMSKPAGSTLSRSTRLIGFRGPCSIFS